MRLGLVTCRPLPEADYDEDLMLAGFTEAGFEVGMVDWRDAYQDAWDMLLIRSTWDYHLYSVDFASWLRQVEGKVWNPTEVCLWNLNKRYLADLSAKGVPIVPTIFDPAAEIPWPKFVVKPTVSGGSFMTDVFDDRTASAVFVEELSRTHEPMIQPYLASVEGEGERSIIWIDGDFTHAIRKEPRFSDGHESVSPAYSPTEEERALANLALAAAPGPLMYARIDVMRDDDGDLCVSELELIEPSLFLAQNPAALEALIGAVKWRSES